MTKTHHSGQLARRRRVFRYCVIWISDLFLIPTLEFRHFRPLVFLASALLLTSGCALTSRCRVTVGNASENTVKDVVVTADKDGLSRVTKVEPRTSAPYWEMDRDIPKSVLVSWKTKEEKTVSRKVALQGNVPQTFRGRVYFQISKGDEVKPFVMPDTNDTSADMPWARPESWEGIPGIPGLTTQ